MHQPAEDTKNQVENEEGAENHQADKVNPRQLEADGIVHLAQKVEKEKFYGVEKWWRRKRKGKKERIKRRERRESSRSMEKTCRRTNEQG